jgi:hypothetical protein
VCVVIAACLLIAAGSQLDYINAERTRMKLVANEPLENATPSLAFATVAMGAFRGLVVDILWMRAETLKEQGQFFDAQQLADGITRLQPRFAAVWDFQAWNMAYNISVAIPASEPQERWRWVRAGYELLRDKGIPTNRHSILLYHRLGLIFQHKIGGVTDEANRYYKLQLAQAMQELLDGSQRPRDAFGGPGPADELYFEALANAPTDWIQLTQDPNVAGLITSLKSADKTFAGKGKKLVDNYLALRQNPGRFKEAFRVIDDFRGTKALEKLDIFAKAWHLRNRWKLEPALMRRLNMTYGPADFSDPNKHYPLDWRHPDTHAIYWAVKGLQMAGTKSSELVGFEKKGVWAREDHYSADEINTDRMVAHSLKNLFERGKLFVYDAQGESGPVVFLQPDLRMFDSYNKARLATIEKYTTPGEDEYNSHQIGHRNMLKNAVFMFYQAGNKRQAQRIYDELRRRYPLDEFKVPMVVFVRQYFVEKFKVLDVYDATQNIQMLLLKSYFLYAIRDDDGAYGREKLAKEIYDYYHSKHPPEQTISLPPFRRLRCFALMYFLNDAQFSPEVRASLVKRMEIERPGLLDELTQEKEKLRKEYEESQR